MLYQITEFFTHLLWKRNTEVLLQDIVHTTLTGLAVNSDNIGLISSSHIHRINRQIRN